MTTRTKRTPRVRTNVSAATTNRRALASPDLMSASRGRDERQPRSEPVADASTANDLNAGRGTEGRREDSVRTTQSNQRLSQPGRGTTAARTRRDDVPRPAPDGSTSDNTSASAYETEGLRERSSKNDVEDGIAG